MCHPARKMFPQGLKPFLPLIAMSELKLRPPNEFPQGLKPIDNKRLTSGLKAPTS
jgi:hypothetical protein